MISFEKKNKNKKKKKTPQSASPELHPESLELLLELFVVVRCEQIDQCVDENKVAAKKKKQLVLTVKYGGLVMLCSLVVLSSYIICIQATITHYIQFRDA